MPSTLEQITERLRQARAAQSRATLNSLSREGSAAARLGLPFLPGDRVFDTASGFEGVVADCVTTGQTGQLRLCVTLGDGRSVERTVAQLIARPSLPRSGS